jgi:hypothetical protein
MKDAIRHLDKRFTGLRRLAQSPRPPKGWLRAVRDALGMTTAQFARRLTKSSAMSATQSNTRATHPTNWRFALNTA